jgi:exopolysaccharide biosynthesis predicted pyruvyltransferase EpsI
MRINKRKIEKFEKFMNDNFNLTKRCKSLKEIDGLKLENKYDYFVTGSDQTWNDYAVEHVYNRGKSIYPYFLSFVKEKTKIAFSMSIGNTTFELLNKKRELINKYKYISTREESGKDILSKITDKNIDVVVDPTIILTQKEWCSMIDDKRIEDENYILLYTLCTNSTIDEWINEIKKFNKNKNLKVVMLCPFVSKKIPDVINYVDSGPYEFLKLFRDASYTIVDSFHGLCFSVIFRKNFFVLGNKYHKKDIRKNNLLKKFNLLDRIVENEKEINVIPDVVDYKKSEKLISDEIIYAKNILKKYLS